MQQVRGPEALELSLVIHDDFVGPDGSERVLGAMENSSPSVLDTEDLEHCRRVGDDGEGVLGDGVLHLSANFRVDSSGCDSDVISLVEFCILELLLGFLDAFEVELHGGYALVAEAARDLSSCLLPGNPQLIR